MDPYVLGTSTEIRFWGLLLFWVRCTLFSTVCSLVLVPVIISNGVGGADEKSFERVSNVF